jgi:hypothetical protein
MSRSLAASCSTDSQACHDPDVLERRDERREAATTPTGDRGPFLTWPFRKRSSNGPEGRGFSG